MARKEKRHVVHHRRVEHRVHHTRKGGGKKTGGLSIMGKSPGIKLGY